MTTLKTQSMHDDFKKKKKKVNGISFISVPLSSNETLMTLEWDFNLHELQKIIELKLN